MNVHYHEIRQSGIKKYQCGYNNCGKVFERNGAAYNHYVAKHTTRFQCGTCQSCFKCISSLKEHERIHTGEKPFKCKYKSCHKSFRTKGHLNVHLKRHDTS